jgi:hypothetical protein
MERALKAYADDVSLRRFPAEEHSFAFDEQEWVQWLEGSRTDAID